ncbi:hypothetical protein [Cryobacterium sp. TMT4-31]|uniref:hypothetical protein n=1 Tax=Cryobacterium sp. TMT4-31 TaxID=1259259 RepID=UPI00106A58B3|nr:hypothetical protein [Cryobacterium sp. TMT4-31]TFC87450.1 hypothetical protein E3T19_12505 [Cryobacterium sp. TMT4-31]
MNLADLLILVVDASATPTPSPNPGDPTIAANVALSNYYLAILILVAALAVITIALVFAYNYHVQLLKVINSAVKNGQTPKTTTDDAAIQGAEPAILGPDTGVPSTQLVFALMGVAGEVSWVADGGLPPSGSGTGFATTFDKAGRYKVSATYFDGDNVTKTLGKDVVIAAAEAPVSASSSGIALPFVIKNWGRLVVVIFGVGVISALMSTKILDAAAGVGILGTLLGVGAVTATSGAGGDKPSNPES